uniref:DNA/RNA non-specific endonuclease n=1 Tax=Faecalitalea cylindroides TaxID=39483 RepID=UPI001E3D6091
PQLDSINQGKVKQVENIARKLKEQGHKVDYEVKVNYGDKSNPLRPTSFEPRITVDGQSYHLESNLKKIYNNLDISKVDKMKITVNEKYDSAKTNMIESNKFGKEGALIAGGLTLTTSIAEDLKLVINGEMQIEDMAVDVVQDTVTAGGLGYLEGFAEGTICTAMRKSGSKLITGLAKTGIPGMTIDFGIKSYDSISNYIEGNIDEFELIYDLGENVTTTIAGFETAQIGATLGSGLGPVGTISGGLIGGMVGYCISSELYVAAIDAGADGLEFFGEKANEFGKYCVDVATEHIPDFVGDVASSLNEFATEFELPFHF